MGKINKEKEVLLPVELLKELLRYEHETGLFYWIKKPSKRVKIGQLAGTVDINGYMVIGIKSHHYQAHRLAWLYVHGKFPNDEQPFIDHINGKKADNRIVNLRIASGAENQKNLPMNSNNISGVNGVYRVSALNGAKTKKNWYWRATWHDENGKQKCKDFPVNTYGEDEAKNIAVKYRVEQLLLLELNHGIIYSLRHGDRKKGENNDKSPNH